MNINRWDVPIDKNSIVDQGDGVIHFSNGLTLSDESEQLNGTRYEMASMDLSRFDGQVFANHDYDVQALIGEAMGVAKQGTRLVAQGVRFAINQSPLAAFVYNMVTAGFIKAVSIGTTGPYPGEDGIYRNAILKEFSFVGIGNNESAVINSAKNVIAQSEKSGLDTAPLKYFLHKNAIELEEQQPEGDQETPEAEPDNKPNEETPMTLEELRAKKAAGTITEEEQTQLDALEAEAAAADEKDEAGEAQNKAILAAISKVGETVSGLITKVAEIEKNQFDNGAIEPQFRTNGAAPIAAAGSRIATFKNMDWKDLTAKQIEAFWNMSKNGDEDSRKLLLDINKFNRDELVAKKMVKNTITIADFGNFVTNPELITEIQGFRSNYQALLNVFIYQETTSLQMGWIKRSGDIDMEELDSMCDDGADGNLKPISEYDATPQTSNLYELAAVTPVCNAATLFLAADLLQDIAQGYRTSFDRNLARGVISVLELAAEDNDGMSYPYSGGSIDTDAERLEQIRLAVDAIGQDDNGVLVMNYATMGIIRSLAVSTGNGGVLAVRGFDGALPTVWGRSYVLVPNDLMPTLGDTGTYKTFKFQGANVVINHAIFNADPAYFRGRQRGGLQYDLSTEAAYEVNGVVKSAYQRNEIVLRGSHFRGAAYTDNSRVSAVRAGAVIS